MTRPEAGIQEVDVAASQSYVIQGPLTVEIANVRSPVRQFLGELCADGLRDVQRRYREGASDLAVPAVPRSEADPGTVGTAADWLLRFLVDSEPELNLVMMGAVACARVGIRVLPALAEVVRALGISLPSRPAEHVRVFTGPTAGNGADDAALARSCWVLALITEAYRGGPMVAAAGPLGRFRGATVTSDDLLGLAPSAGLDQLAAFRHVFSAALIPQLAGRTGTWALGPTFTGSALIKADADLIAAGLLIDLKTSAKKPSLGVTDLLQVIGYALLDFDDEYRLNALGIFSARYSYLATWELPALLSELAGHNVDLRTVRGRFRDLLLACHA
jgi:hypothetical protein